MPASQMASAHSNPGALSAVAGGNNEGARTLATHTAPAGPLEDGGAEARPDYAHIIKSHGITRFEFRYQTGQFYALNEAGEVLSSGATIKDVLSSL